MGDATVGDGYLNDAGIRDRIEVRTRKQVEWARKLEERKRLDLEVESVRAVIQKADNEIRDAMVNRNLTCVVCGNVTVTVTKHLGDSQPSVYFQTNHTVTDAQY